MAQFEVLDYLKSKGKRGATSKEIQKEFKLNLSSIDTNLRKLYAGKFINKREIMADDTQHSSWRYYVR